MPARRKTTRPQPHSPVTAEALAARDLVAALIIKAIALTGRSDEEFAAVAGVGVGTLQSWKRTREQHYRNPTAPQLARVFAANGCDLTMDVRLSGQDGGDPRPYADGLLRCGTSDKRGPLQSLWLDGVYSAAVWPAELATEIVARWYAVESGAEVPGVDAG
jgi:DNA-binding transcriptional regulator YiaG